MKINVAMPPDLFLKINNRMTRTPQYDIPNSKTNLSIGKTGRNNEETIQREICK